jgi:hypothetical protein
VDEIVLNIKNKDTIEFKRPNDVSDITKVTITATANAHPIFSLFTDMLR